MGRFAGPALGRDPVVRGRTVAVESALSVVAGFGAMGPEHGLTSHMLSDKTEEGNTTHPVRAHILCSAYNNLNPTTTGDGRLAVASLWYTTTPDPGFASQTGDERRGTCQATLG